MKNDIRIEIEDDYPGFMQPQHQMIRDWAATYHFYNYLAKDTRARYFPPDVQQEHQAALAEATAELAEAKAGVEDMSHAHIDRVEEQGHRVGVRMARAFFDPIKTEADRAARLR